MSKDVQYMQGCAVQIRYIISTSEDASKSSGFGTGVHYSEILSKE